MTATGYGVGVRRSVGHTVDQAAGVVLPAAVWAKVCLSLKGELGDDTFGSWLGQAVVRQTGAGQLVLVTPTGIAATGCAATPGAGPSTFGASWIRWAAAWT